MENKVIGIEGYVGAGKTSICRKLINLIPNSIILEGGNLYRAIVYSLMTSGINLEDLKKNMNHVDIKSVMEKLNIGCLLMKSIRWPIVHGGQVL